MSEADFLYPCEAEVLEMPMPIPTYTNVCWNCGAAINDVECQHAGFDETGSNGYECNVCGRHLGHQRNPHLYQ